MCKKKVVGNFPPFSEKHIFNNAHIKAVEEYIKQIVGRIKDNYKIVVEPDFKNYGLVIIFSEKRKLNIRVEKKNSGRGGRDLNARRFSGTTQRAINLPPTTPL